MEGVLTQVDRLLELQRLEQARNVLGPALRAEPENASLLAAAAQVEYSAEKYAEALSLAERALSRSPHLLRARLVLFEVCIKLELHGRAEETILSLIRDHPESGHLYACYARLLLKHLQFDKAEALLKEALRLDPDDAQARILCVFVALAQGRTEATSEDLSTLVRNEPDAYSTGLVLMQVLTRKGKYAEALEVGRVLLRAHPQDSDLVEALIELKSASHWSTLPLRPFQRAGWLASALVWAGAAGTLLMLRRFDGPLVGLVSFAWIGFVIYSWVYPPLLKRWFRSRGF